MQYKQHLGPHTVCTTIAHKHGISSSTGEKQTNSLERACENYNFCFEIANTLASNYFKLILSKRKTCV